MSVSNYPPLSGGLGVYVANLSKTLSTNGHQVTVLTLEGDCETEADEDGVRVVRLPRRLGYRGVFASPVGANSFEKLRQLISEVDIVNAHTRYFPLTYFSVSTAKDLQVPIVLTEHGGGFVNSTSWPTLIGARLADQSIGRWALSKADQVLAVSAVSQDFVERLSGRRPIVVGNGIDLNFWDRSKSVGQRASDLRSQGSSSNLPGNVIFVGRLVAEKGWRLLLDAWGSIPLVDRAGSRLIYVGDGPDLDNLKSAVLARGFQDVVCLGHQSPQVLRDLLARGILVNPSRASEGFQTTLLEARALGAFVITTPVGGAAETVEPGVNGEILDSKNVQEWARAITEALPFMGVPTGRQNVEQYEWQEVANRYIDQYSRLLSSRSS